MSLGLTLAIAAVVLGTILGLCRRWYDGRFGVSKESRESMRLTATDVGAELGERATLVQFSSAFCAPCRATRVVLGDIATRVDGVVHVEIDAESHLELVRRLGIVRTPTVFVLDSEGQTVRRASGAPRRADVLAVLAGLPTSPGVTDDGALH